MNKELDDDLVRFRNLPMPVRVVYGRPRTFISLAVGVIAFFLLPGTLRLPTRLVVGWDVFTVLYLVLAYIMMLRCDVAHIRRSAVLQDDGRFLLLLLTALGTQTGQDAALGKTTFVTQLGVDGARQRVRDLLARADSALSMFGAKGDVLKAASRFVAERKN